MEESIKSTWIGPFKDRWQAHDNECSNKLYKRFNIIKNDKMVKCLEVCHPQGKELTPIIEEIKKFINE